MTLMRTSRLLTVFLVLAAIAFAAPSFSPVKHFSPAKQEVQDCQWDGLGWWCTGPTMPPPPCADDPNSHYDYTMNTCVCNSGYTYDPSVLICVANPPPPPPPPPACGISGTPPC